MNNDRKYKFSPDEYFEVSVDRIVPEKARSFPLFIYLRHNDHLILRYTPESEITVDHLKTYKKSKLKNFWCPNEFKDNWLKYLENHKEYYEQLKNSESLNDQKGEKNNIQQAQASSKNDDNPGYTPIPDQALSDEPRSKESTAAIQALTSEEMSQDEKMEVLSNISNQLLSVLTDIDSGDKSLAEHAHQKCREFAEDVIKVAAKTHEMGNLFEDIEMIRQLNMLHASAVSTFSVMIAMAIGYIEQELLTDLYLGGLLHDIGYAKLDPEVLAVPVNQLNPQQIEHIKSHIQETILLLNNNGVTCSPNVAQILEQHHESFDGKGYPNKLVGFQISELSQIVAFSDLIDDLMSGKLDGIERSLSKALVDIQIYQNPNEAKMRFEPELFNTILSTLNKSSSKKLKQSLDKVKDHISSTKVSEILE